MPCNPIPFSLWSSALALLGCNGDDPNDTGTTDDTGITDDTGTTDDTGDTESEPAMVRVVHASGDAPSVDVYVAGNSTPIIEDLDYGDTTAYLSLAAGDYALELRAAGSAASSTAAYTQTLTVPAGVDITVLANGSFASADAADSFRLSPLVEAWGTAGAGNANVRVIHAAADAPAVDIDVNDDASVELEDVPLFGDSGAAGVPIPADVTNIGVYLPNGTKVTAFTTPDLPEANLFVIAVGFLADEPRDATGFSLLAVGPSGTVGFIKQDPTVDVLHGALAGNVDVFANDTLEIVSDLAPTEMARIQVPPGTYNIDVHAANNATTTPEGSAVITADLTLAAGNEYLAIAAGESGTGAYAYEIIALADGFTEPASGKWKLRAGHAAALVPTVDVGVVPSTTLTALFEDVTFGEVSPAEGLDVDPGTGFVFGVGTDTQAPVVTWSGIDAAAGARIIAAPIKDNGDISAVPLALIDVGASPWGLTVVAED